jgi:hypothetical protein
MYSFHNTVLWKLKINKLVNIVDLMKREEVTFLNENKNQNENENENQNEKLSAK